MKQVKSLIRKSGWLMWNDMICRERHLKCWDILGDVGPDRWVTWEWRSCNWQNSAMRMKENQNFLRGSLQLKFKFKKIMAIIKKKLSMNAYCIPVVAPFYLGYDNITFGNHCSMSTQIFTQSFNLPSDCSLPHHPFLNRWTIFWASTLLYLNLYHMEMFPRSFIVTPSILGWITGIVP